ncbi:hypothetical protein MACH05_16230 [Qipengyuania nanhaisediminis]
MADFLDQPFIVLLVISQLLVRIMRRDWRIVRGGRVCRGQVRMRLLAREAITSIHSASPLLWRD